MQKPSPSPCFFSHWRKLTRTVSCVQDNFKMFTKYSGHPLHLQVSAFFTLGLCTIRSFNQVINEDRQCIIYYMYMYMYIHVYDMYVYYMSLRLCMGLCIEPFNLSLHRGWLALQLDFSLAEFIKGLVYRVQAIPENSYSNPRITVRLVFP